LAVAPITVLIVATGVAFGPLLGLIYSLLGCLMSAMLTYWVGSLIGRETVRRLAGKQVSRLSQRLARHGLTTILILRILPVAPFTVINVIAGASKVRFRDFILATFLGLLPGLLAMTFFGSRLESAIREPKVENFIILGALVVALVGITLWLRRRFIKSETGAPTNSAAGMRERVELWCGTCKTHTRRLFGGFL
jgi:uncharacterized membrane protein YdjX (TVP38/TMEM64 family)